VYHNATAIRNSLTQPSLWYNSPVLELRVAETADIHTLHSMMRECRKCESDGFPVQSPPVVAGVVPAPFMVIGQAPSISDLREQQMYVGPAGRKLIGWLIEAGFSESDIGTTVYMTALTKCFPGRLPGKSTDRAPSGKERANCRPWLNAQIGLARPRVIILFGKMSIDTFLPRMSLEEAVGSTFTVEGTTYIPLPHSSGASTWLNDPGHRDLLKQAIERVREQRLIHLEMSEGTA
jgi:uracil-DNA glycosylase family 4